MSHLRTLVTLLTAAATAFLVGTSPAAAVPAAAVPAATVVGNLPSPILDVYLEGACRNSQVTSFVTLQRINWMWAPLPMDNPPLANERDRKPLPKVLIPRTMQILGVTAQWRARHDFVAQGEIYAAPGRQPADQAICILQGQSVDGPVEVLVTGIVVTIPAWLDALLPPITPPAKV